MAWSKIALERVKTITYFTFSQVKSLFGLKPAKNEDNTDMRSHFWPNETQACILSSYLSPLFNKKRNTQLDTGKYVTHNSRTTGILAPGDDQWVREGHAQITMSGISKNEYFPWHHQEKHYYSH